MPQARHFDGGLGGRTSSASGGNTPSERNRNQVEPWKAGDSPSACGLDERTLERFLTTLMRGDRIGSRSLVGDHLEAGTSAFDLLENLVWPALTAIDGWSRRDQISAVHQHAATLLLAQLARSLEDRLPNAQSRGRSMLVTSGQKPLEEVAGLIFAGIAEAEGYEVLFLGGGVESDDAFAEIGARMPDLVVSIAAAGGDAARLRRLLGALREQNPVPGLQIAVGGGVFSRAPGLAEELGVDIEGDSPFDLLRAIQAAGAGSPRNPSCAANPPGRRSAKAA